MNFQTKLLENHFAKWKNHFDAFSGSANQEISKAIYDRIAERTDIDWSDFKFTDEQEPYVFTKVPPQRYRIVIEDADLASLDYDKIIDESLAIVRSFLADLILEGIDVEVYLPIIFDRVTIDTASFQPVLPLGCVIRRMKDGVPV